MVILIDAHHTQFFKARLLLTELPFYLSRDASQQTPNIAHFMGVTESTLGLDAVGCRDSESVRKMAYKSLYSNVLVLAMSVSIPVGLCQIRSAQ